MAYPSAPSEHGKAFTDCQSEWEQITDPASGRLYYHNMTTGETRWEAPPGFQPAPVYPAPPPPQQQPYMPQPVYAAQPSYVMMGDPYGRHPDEQCAMIMFIVGIFIGVVGLINICMHCGHPDRRVSRWARYSAVLFFIWTGIIAALWAAGALVVFSNENDNNYPN